LFTYLKENHAQNTFVTFHSSITFYCTCTGKNRTDTNRHKHFTAPSYINRLNCMARKSTIFIGSSHSSKQNYSSNSIYENTRHNTSEEYHRCQY